MCFKYWEVANRSRLVISTSFLCLYSRVKSNATLTRETQCNLTEDVATDCEPTALADTEQFRKAMLLNTQLAEELAAAKRDIETLQSRFCELEVDK